MSEASPRRDFLRSSAVGGTVAVILFTWLLTAGTFDLFRWQQFGDFYDAQAHSFLDGSITVDPEVLGIEAFLVDGRSYMYQGPVPALLRVPVVAVAGDRLDGRLTAPSMLLALLLALVATVRLHWRIRCLLRGDTPVDRREQAMVGGLTFVAVGGSLLLFQASRAWIYHEAILWGAALSIAAIDQLVRACMRDPDKGGRRALAWCSALTGAALLTRASVGLGPLTGLGLIACGRALAAVRARPDRRARIDALGALGAAALPLAGYAAVNLAKFGSLFAVPFRAQQLAMVDPARQAFLDANDGTFFGLQFVPTTLVHYANPVGLRVNGTFPFVEFPHLPGPVVGDAHFDLLDRAGGLPATTPLLTVLACVAAVAVVRAGRSSPATRLRIPLIAAAASAATLLPFGYIAQRYLGDAMPLLVLGGTVGLQVWLARTPSPRRRTVDLALLVAGLVTVWASVGLSLDYQRLWSTNVAPAAAAGFLGVQLDLGGTLEVERGDVLPATGPEGALFALGECDALYLSDGLPATGVNRTPWNLVEGTEASGHWRLRLRFASRPPGTAVPILTTGTAAAPNLLLARHAGRGRMRFEYESATGLDEVGREVRLSPGRWYDIDLLADWRVDRLVLTVGDVVALESFYGEQGPTSLLGENPWIDGVERRFPGELRRLRTGTPLCRELTKDAS